MRIGLHMIVKGESHNIVQCLDSCKGLVDFYVIAVDDREDSDQTYELIKDRENSYVYRQTWNDSFAKARNDALEKLIELCPDVDYILWIDGDDQWGTESQGSISHEEVRKRLQDEKPAVVNNQYVYAEDLGSLSPSLSYRRLRLFAHEKGKPLTHTWEGSAHETLVCRRILDRPSVDWDDWVLVHYRNDNIDFKSKTGRNIKMLEKELKEFPDNPRTMFYLGREYKDYGDFDKSIVMLTKYLHKSNFTLEKYQALLDLGYMYLGKEDYDSAEEKARQAIDLIPEVSFAYNLLGEIKMSLNRPDLARMYFAQSVYAPHGPVLFDYIPSRTYLPHRHLSVACYYSGMYKEALNHHMIARKLAPHDLSLRYNDPWLIDNTEDFPQELSDLNGCNELFLKSESVSQFTSDLLPEDTFEVSDEEAISRIDSINDCRCFYITIPDLNDEMLDLIVSKLNNEKPAAIIVNKFGNWRVKFTVAKFLSRHSEVSLIRSYDSLRGNQNFIADDGIGIIIVRK